MARSSGSPVRCIEPGLRSIQVPWSSTKLSGGPCRRSRRRWAHPDIGKRRAIGLKAGGIDIGDVVGDDVDLVIQRHFRDKPTTRAFSIDKLPLHARRAAATAAPPAPLASLSQAGGIETKAEPCQGEISIYQNLRLLPAAWRQAKKAVAPRYPAKFSVRMELRKYPLTIGDLGSP